MTKPKTKTVKSGDKTYYVHYVGKSISIVSFDKQPEKMFSVPKEFLE